MSIQLSGFNSGLPVEDIISQLIEIERRPIQLLEQRRQDLNFRKANYDNVESRVSTMLKSIEALTNRTTIIGGNDLFFAKSATSSNDAIASASVTPDAAIQNLSVEVISLATRTKASSTVPVGQTITTGHTVGDMAQGTVSTGTFTIFYNGDPRTINIGGSGETIANVFSKITAAIPELPVSPVINASGQFQFVVSDGNTLNFGAASDTSNFLSAAKMFSTTFTDTAGPNSNYVGAGPVYAINPNVDVTTAAANLNTAVAGGSEFSINGETFTVGSKTLKELITEINNSSAGVTASYDPVGNSFNLIADDPGSSYILMSDDAGNFLQSMGLINGTDTTSSQTQGANAEVVINGSTYYSPSNTVDESITGLTGVTLNLNSASPGDVIDINIGRNSSALTDAIKTLVDDVNDVISYIDTQTDPESDTAGLKGERSLVRFRQQLRQTITDVVAGLAGSSYDSMPLVGISTGAVGTGGSQASSTIQFDAAKFTAALEDNFTDVYNLFKATTADEGFDGIFTRLETLADAALETASGSEGLFAAFDQSVNSRIDSLDDSILRAEDRLERKETLLRQQFTMMERMIAQFQSQGNALAGLQQQLGANSG